ncbi:TPA: phage tail protein [Salmonella enterica]
MKPLMPTIDTPDQVFHDGDPSTGELGTICSAEWLNNVQGNIRNIQAECIAILKATGFTPDSANDGQLWAAIQAAIKSQVPAATVTTAGITQLSSSVTSDSETIAATLKAVKIAMDNANARMAKDRNGADIPNKALFRQNLELGNSATLNTGTTANTVAAGDDARILATKKAIDDTQTGLAVQGVMWISTADDLNNLPSGARRFARNNTGITVLPSDDYFFLEVLAKRDTANGSCILATSVSGNVWMGIRYTVPADANFTWIQLNQNVQNLGLTDTVNRASHVYTDGNINGSMWGGWLNNWLNGQFAARDNNINARATADWVRQNFLSGFRLGAVESAQVWRAYGYGDNPPYVITGVINGNTDDLIDNLTRRPLQMYINGWRNVDWL